MGMPRRRRSADARRLRAGHVILDLFAGPDGWSRALHVLGVRDVGLEWDEWACKTRSAAGQLTIRTDVAMYPTWPFIGRTSGVIASPPCQAWSMAGKRLGLLACRDERSLLAAEPMRYLYALNTVGEPDWVAMEEVPDVLPLWKQYAAVLRGWGFSVWYGILNAADFGVPQTRKRAILLASRVRTAQPPTPTHAQLAEPESLFGPGRARWVSMAEALGWGATDRPVPTVCAGGGPGGGPEPFPSGSRKTLSDARERGTWMPRPDGVWSCSPAAKAPDGRPGTAPATTGPPTLRRPRSPPRPTAGPGPCAATTRPTPPSALSRSRPARCSSGAPRERVHLGRRTRHTFGQGQRCTGRPRADPDHRPRNRPPADLPRRLPAAI